MLTIQGTRFGDVTVDPNAVIDFPNGLIGFPRDDRFVLLERDADDGSRSDLGYLQSTKTPELCFPVIDAAAMQAEYEAFIRGADLLIADAQYTAKEYPTKQGFGHTTVELLTEIAHQCEVKQLAIFHHEPQHTDTMLDKLAERRLISAKGSDAINALLQLFDKGDGIKVDIIFRKGEVYWGPMRLGRQFALF